MPTTSSPPSPRSLSSEFRVIGAVFLGLSVLAIAVPAAMTLAIEILVALLLLIWGAAGLGFATMLRPARGWGAMALFSGLVLVLGVVFLASPRAGTATLTMLLVAVFLIEGLGSILIGLRMRGQMPGWGWIVFSGLSALALGALILAGSAGQCGLGAGAAGRVELPHHRRVSARTCLRPCRGDPRTTRRPVREQATCHVCGLSFPVAELRPWITVRPGVSALIEAEASGWQEGARICQSDLARFRRQYVEQMLEDERGELSALDRPVLDSLESGERCRGTPRRSSTSGRPSASGWPTGWRLRRKLAIHPDLHRGAHPAGSGPTSPDCCARPSIPIRSSCSISSSRASPRSRRRSS